MDEKHVQKLQKELIQFFVKRNLSLDESLNFLSCFLILQIYGSLNITNKIEKMMNQEEYKQVYYDLVKFFEDRNIGPFESFKFLASFLMGHLYSTMNLTTKEEIEEFLAIGEALKFFKKGL